MRSSSSAAFAVFLSLAWLLAPPRVDAGWAIQELTDNAYSDRNPSTNGTDIAWLGRPTPPGQDRVFWNDGTTTRMIDDGPPIWGANAPIMTDSTIFYMGYDDPAGRSGNYQIFTFDLSSQRVSQLTNNPRYHGYMQAVGANAAWLDCDPSRSSKGDVYFYNGSIGLATRISSAPAASGSISMSRNYIAWESAELPARRAYLYDIASGVTTELLDGEFTTRTPKVSDTHVAYQRQSEPTQGVLRNLTTGETVELPGATRSASLTETTAFWRESKNDPADGVSKAYYHFYNIATQIVTDLPPLPESTSVEGNIGENLVFSWSDGHDGELFFYKWRTQSFTQITDNEFEDGGADVRGNRIVWMNLPVTGLLASSDIHTTTFAENPDWNGDGSVDADDLAVWTAGFGESNAAHSQGDADADGRVDGADFLLWQQLLSPVSASASVPEANSAKLAVIAFVAINHWRRRG